jgi:hypothetical protein
MRANEYLLAILLLAPLNDALAQQELKIGSQVRITAPECGLHGHTGTLDGVEGDTFILGFGSSEIRCVSKFVSSLDRRVESGAKVVEGAVLGLVIGGFGGAVIGAATYQECVPEGWFDCFMMPESAGQQAAAGAVLGGLLGAGIGALVGVARGDGGWEPVPVDRVRIAAYPRREGFAVKFSVSF